MQMSVTWFFCLQLISSCWAHVRLGSEPLDYSQHGSDWAGGSCASRKLQSPVDLFETQRLASGSFSFQYLTQTSGLFLSNDGNTLSVDMGGTKLGGVRVPDIVNPSRFEEKYYSLERLELHAASEHTLRGVHAPLEVQLVHASYWGHLSVSVLVDCYPGVPPLPQSFLQRALVNEHSGGVESSTWPLDAGTLALQALVPQGPPAYGERSAISGLNLGALVANGTYFMYGGSQTSPPCEAQTWLVRREIVRASCAQVQALTAPLFRATGGAGNFRTVMPLNQREVEVWSAEAYVPPVATSTVAVAARAAPAPAPATLEIPSNAPNSSLAVAVGQAMREEIARQMHDITPVAVNLARSYMRQRILGAVS